MILLDLIAWIASLVVLCFAFYGLISLVVYIVFCIKDFFKK
jgi:hypothetical protein